MIPRQLGLGLTAAALAGGQVGRVFGKKKWNSEKRRWEDPQGNLSRVNYAVAAGSLAGGAAWIGGHKIYRSSPGIASRLNEIAKVRAGGTPDDMGGNLEAKLARLHRRAGGTPEGEVALRKLRALRIRESKTFTGRARKIIGKLTRLSASEQLDLIKFDKNQDRKYRPVAGTVGALTLPGIPGVIVGTSFKKAVVGGSNTPIAADKPVLQSLRRSASKAGVKIHKSTNPSAPAFFWRHKGQGSMLGKLSRAQVMQATGSSAATGIGIGENIRSSLRPGVLAHEIGHATQHRLLNSTTTHVVGKYIPQIGSLYAGITSDEKKAKTAVAASTLAAAPMIASEISASVKGSKLLRGAGVKGIRRLSPAIGLPTYAALTALPYLTYKTKKIIGGYKKETQMSAREQLDEVVALGVQRTLISTPSRRTKKLQKRSIVKARVLGGASLQTETHMSSRDRLHSIIELKAVDLGYTYGSEGYAAPCSPNYTTKKHYPTLYISDREDEIGLPLSGTAKVKFKTRSKTSRQDEEGKRRHSADIEIQSIDVIEEDEAPIKKLKEGAPAKLNTYSARDQLTDIIEFGEGEAVGKGIESALQKIVRLNRSRGSGAVVKRRYTPRQWDRVGQIPYADAEKRLADKLKPGKLHALSARLDGLVELARGDMILKTLKAWGSAQKPEVQKAITKAINEPLLKAVVRGKKKKLGKLLGDREVAKELMPQLRSGLAAQAREDRRSGLMAATGQDIPRLLHHRRFRGDAKKGFSARDKLNHITFADPRPRNSLGMFSGGEEGAPDPNAIGEVYKSRTRTIGQNLAGGAVAGAGATASSGAIKALLSKLKKMRA